MEEMPPWDLVVMVRVAQLFMVFSMLHWEQVMISHYSSGGNPQVMA